MFGLWSRVANEFILYLSINQPLSYSDCSNVFCFRLPGRKEDNEFNSGLSLTDSHGFQDQFTIYYLPSLV